MQYLVSFLEGIVTFLSPCLLPMLPIYVSYFAGGGERSTGRTLGCGLGFAAGFTAVFMAMGALAGTIGGLLIAYSGAAQRHRGDRFRPELSGPVSLESVPGGQPDAGYPQTVGFRGLSVRRGILPGLDTLRRCLPGDGLSLECL